MHLFGDQSVLSTGAESLAPQPASDEPTAKPDIDQLESLLLELQEKLDALESRVNQLEADR
jgi:hypothetical protein